MPAETIQDDPCAACGHVHRIVTDTGRGDVICDCGCEAVQCETCGGSGLAEVRVGLCEWREVVCDSCDETSPGAGRLRR